MRALLLLAVFAVCARAIGTQNYDTTPLPVWVGEGTSADARYGLKVALGDVNSDGLPDVLVGSPNDDTSGTNRGRVFGYYNTGTNFPSSPDWQRGGTAESGISTYYGGNMVIGQFDGDADGDVCVGGVSSLQFRAYYGSGSGLPTASTRLNADTAYIDFPPARRRFFMGRGMAVGDFDGDSYEDLLMGFPGVEVGVYAFHGTAQIYLGSASGLDVDSFVEIAPNPSFDYNNWGHMGGSAAAGQFVGDYAADAIVCAPQFSPYSSFQKSGWCGLWEGGAGANFTAEGFVWSYAASGVGMMFGHAVVAVDVNNDTHSDLVVSAPFGRYGTVYVFVNTGSGLPSTPTQTLSGKTNYGEFGYSLADGGDINKDGYNDVIVGEPYGGTNKVGRVHVLYGSADGTLTKGWFVTGSDSYSLFGASIAGGEDINSDGYPDLVVGAAFAKSSSSDTLFEGTGGALAYEAPVLCDVGVQILADADVVVQDNSYLNYTIIVSNDGPSAAASTVVNFTLSDSIVVSVFDGPACTQIGNSYECSLGSLPVDSETVFNLKTTVPLGTLGVLPASASVVSSTTDTTSSNNDVYIESEATAITDVVVGGLQASSDDVFAGGEITYTMWIANINGPSTAYDVVGFLDLPSAQYSAYQLLTEQGECNSAGADVWCTIGTMLVGSNVSLSFTVSVLPAEAVGLATIYGRVSTGRSTDPVENSVSVSTNILVAADVYVSFVASPLPMLAGSAVTIVMQIDNTGPSVATNVAGEFTVPYPDLSLTGYVESSDLNITIVSPGRAVVIVNGTVGVLTPIPVVLRASLSATLTKNHVVSLTANAYGDRDDDTPANNVRTKLYSVDVFSSVVLSQVIPATAVVGKSFTATVAVQNNGPSANVGTGVACSLPDTWQVTVDTDVGFTTSPAFPCVYDAADNSFNCSIGSLGLKQFVYVIYQVNVADDPTFSGSMLFNCSTWGGAGDSMPARTSIEEVALTTTADVILTAQRFPLTGTITAGEDVVVFWSLYNVGPAPANNPSVLAAIPDDVAVTTACSVNGSTVSCNELTMEVGESASGSITFTPQLAVPPFNLTLTAVSASPDTNPADNAATFLVTTESVTDIGVLFSLNKNPVKGGDTLVFAAVLSNGGPSTAENAVLTLELEGITRPNVTSDYLACSTVYRAANGTATVTCGPAHFPKGVVNTISCTGTVLDTSDFGTLEATATVTTTSQDTQPLNDYALVSTSIRPFQADLSVVVATSPTTTGYAGVPITFYISAKNNGPDTAQDVILTNTLPNVTIASLDLPAFCTRTNVVTVVCSLSTIAKSVTTDPVTFTITPPWDSSGTIVNTATVSGALLDTNSAADTVTTVMNIIRRADVALPSTAWDRSVALQGDTVNLILFVQNYGPCPSPETKVYIEFTGDVFVGQIVGGLNSGVCTPFALANGYECEIDLLNFNALATTVVPVTVSLSASGSVSAHIWLGSQQPDPDSSNNDILRVFTVAEPVPDLSLGVSYDGLVDLEGITTAIAGQPFAIEFIITNLGDACDSMTFTADVPDNVASVGLDPNVTCNYNAAAKRVSCPMPGLASSESVSVTLSLESTLDFSGFSRIRMPGSVSTTLTESNYENNAINGTVKVFNEANTIKTGKNDEDNSESLAMWLGVLIGFLIILLFGILMYVLGVFRTVDPEEEDEARKAAEAADSAKAAGAAAAAAAAASSGGDFEDGVEMEGFESPTAPSPGVPDDLPPEFDNFLESLHSQSSMEAIGDSIVIPPPPDDIDLDAW